MHNSMRIKEDWMRKGAQVIKSGLKGTITTFATSKVNNTIYVHSLYVRLNGTKKPGPVNPNDIDPA